MERPDPARTRSLRRSLVFRSRTDEEQMPRLPGTVQDVLAEQVHLWASIEARWRPSSGQSQRPNRTWVSAGQPINGANGQGAWRSAGGQRAAGRDFVLVQAGHRHPRPESPAQHRQMIRFATMRSAAELLRRGR